MSIENKLRAFATMGSGGIMWLLVALALLVVAIAVDRGLVLLRTHEDVTRRRGRAPFAGEGSGVMRSSVLRALQRATACQADENSSTRPASRC